MKKNNTGKFNTRIVAILLLFCTLLLFTGCDKMMELAQAVGGGNSTAESTRRRTGNTSRDETDDTSSARSKDNPTPEWPTGVTPLAVSDFYLYENGNEVYSPKEDERRYYPHDFGGDAGGYVTSKGIGMDAVLEDIARAYSGVPAELHASDISTIMASVDDLQTLLENNPVDGMYSVQVIYRFEYADGEAVPPEFKESYDSDAYYGDFLVEVYMISFNFIEGRLDDISFAYDNWSEMLG